MAQKLADLQAALQNDILTGDGTTLERLSVPTGSTPKDRLLVYQNAYVLRLLEFLNEDYEMTWTFLGDELFHRLAREYIQEHPSQTFNARWFGQQFPEFLASQPVAREHPVIPDIARIERALSDAFDAPDARHLTLEDLASKPPETIATARFSLHPSVILLQVTTNAYDIFRALSAQEDVPAAQLLDEPGWALIWRWDWSSRHTFLDPEEGTLLDLLRQGNSFAQLCEVAAMFQEPDTAALRMAQYLQRWTANGFLVHE